MDRKQSEKLKQMFIKAYDMHSQDIFRFIYYKTRQDKEKAKDLLQQTFLKVWKYCTDKNAKIKNIKALLYKTAYNLIIDESRKQNHTVSLDETLPPDIISQKGNSEHLDKEQTLIKILNSMKDEYRDVLIMRYIEDMSISEISQVLGKSNANIYVLIHRALKHAKKKLEEIYEK